MTTENQKLIRLVLTQEQVQLVRESILKNIMVLYSQANNEDQDTIEALDDILPELEAAIEKAEEPNGAEQVPRQCLSDRYEEVMNEYSVRSLDMPGASITRAEEVVRHLNNLMDSDNTTEEEVHIQLDELQKLLDQGKTAQCVHCKSTDIEVVCHECGCIESVTSYRMFNI